MLLTLMWLIPAQIAPCTPDPLRLSVCRRDPTNYRPRINKRESTKDREQKQAGSYYYLNDD